MFSVDPALKLITFCRYINGEHPMRYDGRKSDSTTTKENQYNSLAAQILKDPHQDPSLRNMSLDKLAKKFKKALVDIPPLHSDWRLRLEKAKVPKSDRTMEEAGPPVDFFAKLGVELLHEGRTKADKDAKKQEVTQFNDSAFQSLTILPIDTHRSRMMS